MKRFMVAALLGLCLFYILPKEALASDKFFVKGSCYLFTARSNVWSAGKVVSVTPQEVVMSDLVRVFVQTGDFLKVQDKVLGAYINGSNRAYISKTPMREVSYSRSAMTAIKLNNCNK